MLRRSQQTALGLVLTIICALIIANNHKAEALPSLSIQRINPSDTGRGITSEPGKPHYIVTPTAPNGKLVLFLGGSQSEPASYTDLSDEVARIGFGAINLRYPNDKIIGTSCRGDDTCFTQFRGEILFGGGITYASRLGSFDYLPLTVNKENSVINRLVALLVFLKKQTPYWKQFLLPAPRSPYTTGAGNYFPNWSKIVVSGHSQGGGHAAFLASHLNVARAVVFSSPNDNVNGSSASWITAPSATPVTRIWGLRNAAESIYGDATAANWANFGGLGIGGLNTTAGGTERLIGAGTTCHMDGSHRLVTDKPSWPVRFGGGLPNHGSTAANRSVLPATTEPRAAWDYLFTGVC